ncbi:MAG: PAS domain S-box protein [Candidatus Riflebacteria bacterium]|nr:PAS domain S-box protein [Candidatus Riflebacteria bacterium]
MTIPDVPVSIDLPGLTELLSGSFALAGVPVAVVDRAGRAIARAGAGSVCLRCGCRERCLDEAVLAARGAGAASWAAVPCADGLPCVVAPAGPEPGRGLSLLLGPLFFEEGRPDPASLLSASAGAGLAGAGHREEIAQVPSFPRDAVLKAVDGCRRLLGLFLGPKSSPVAGGPAASRPHETPDLHRTVAEFSHDWECWIDPEGRFLYVSPSCLRMTGYAREEFLANPRLLETIVHPEDRDAVLGRLGDLRTGATESAEFTFRITTRSGDERLVNHRCQPVRGADGAFMGQRVSLRDITRERLSEQALRHSEEERLQLAEMLRENDERYSKAFHACPVPMAVTTLAEGRFIAVNDAFVRITEWTSEELIGRTGAELDMWIEPAEREHLLDLVRRVGELRSVPAKGRTKSGKIRDVLWSMQMVSVRSQPCLMVTVLDITEQNRLSEALRSSENHYRVLAEASLDHIFIIGLDDTVKYVNPSGLEFLGLPADQVVGQPRSIFFPADQVQVQRQSLARVFVEKKPLRIERWHGDEATGSWLDTRLVPLVNSTGKVEAVLGISRDITERKRAEAALEVSETRYRTLVDNLDFGVVLVDAEHTIVMANATHHRWLGRAPGDLAGKRCHREFDGRDDPCPQCPGVRAMATGEVATAETEGVLADGKKIAVRIRAFPVRTPSGGIWGFTEVVENITELRQAQAEQRELEARVQRTQKFESLGILAGGIAHDFDNLLCVIIGNADLAQEALAVDSPARANLQAIETAGNCAAALCKQMLAYAGKEPVMVESVNLSKLLESMDQLLRASVSRQAQLRSRPDHNARSFAADSAQVSQVVLNLVVNASEALGEREGTIDVSTSSIFCNRALLDRIQQDIVLPEGLYVCLEVHDDGCGMDRSTAERVFDPFFSTKFPGRGLGLAAVQGIVRGHRGAIWVETEPGRGTTFRVIFPALPESDGQPVPERPVGEPAGAGSGAAPERPAAGSRGKKKAPAGSTGGDSPRKGPTMVGARRALRR